MISVYCEGHGGNALLSTNNITAIQRITEGLKVAFVCTCGHAGEWLIAQKAEVESDPEPKRVLDKPEPLAPIRHAAVGAERLGLIRR